MNYRDLIDQLKPMEGQLLTAIDALWMPTAQLAPYLGCIVERVCYLAPGDRADRAQTVHIQLQGTPGIKLRSIIAEDVRWDRQDGRSTVRLYAKTGDIAVFHLTSPPPYHQPTTSTTTQPQTNPNPGARS